MYDNNKGGFIMKNLGLSTCGKSFGPELFEQYAAAGIEHMEISCRRELCDNFDFKAAEKYSKETGVNIWSFHLPFLPFASIEISVPELCENTVKYFSEFIKKGADIGITKFIVHPSGERIADCDRKMRIETAQNSLFKLSEIADSEGAMICVEDLPRACLGKNSEEIKQLISVSDKLGVCFDTNHLLKEDNIHFIEQLSSRIVTTHISDYDFEDEKHWLPGEGLINWPELMTAFKKIGYNGVFMYEVGFTSKTLERPRDLNVFDFAENAANYLFKE